MPQITSTAVVATDRGARYGKQLASHLGRKAEATWDEAAGTGRVTFDGGAAHVDLETGAEALRFELHTPADRADVFEDVVGRHFVRFGVREGFVVAWVRSDGSTGTRQESAAD